ncbi:ANK REP REGION domain-containing protein [Aphis craccivora]|uniref:ANK REP REGION domain-containing protein n=1 Tax=Aphis craccivora TaxID=307492 RepID=A0A6G0ZI51_APHCR|nr:ANK REP REGION domain-containing protein [Aphis craccivora]
MCLWKLLLLGWTRPKSSDSGDCKGGADLRRQHTSSDDDMSDSGISSGEFSLENVCEDSCGPCTVPQPAPTLQAHAALNLPAHEENRQVDVLNAEVLRACRAGDFNFLGFIAGTDINRLQAEDSRGAMGSHYAARNGQLSVLRFLKIHGIRNLNKKSSVGYTALHEASINGHVPCVEWLIRYSGCKPTEKAVDGCNVLHLASKIANIVDPMLINKTHLKSKSIKIIFILDTFYLRSMHIRRSNKMFEEIKTPDTNHFRTFRENIGKY